jgi:hypothetical protein
MRRFNITLPEFKAAGRRRVRAADDVIGELAARPVVGWGKMLADAGLLPPMEGGAPTTFVGIANTAAWAATPGTLILGPLYQAQAALVLSVASISPCLMTAAANGVSFCYAPTTGTLGGAATGGTVYGYSGTQPTTTAIQQTPVVIAPTPAAGLNAGCWTVGIGAAAAVANNSAFFGLLNFD